MPDFVKVVGDVKCPHCGCQIDTFIEIQWGKVPGMLHVGDQVKWVIVDDRMVPPFTLIDGQTHWNCGDPSVENVLVFDGNRYAVDADQKLSCLSCGGQIGGVMAVITSNIVSEIKSCTMAEMRAFFGSTLGKADIIVLERNGSHLVREDWFDPPVRYSKT